MRFFITFILLHAFVSNADAQETSVSPSTINDVNQCEPNRTDSFGACRVGGVTRSALTPNDLAFVPTSGFVLWSGGFMSSVGVYVFDIQTQRLAFFRSKTLERTLMREDLNQIVTLNNEERDALVALSNQIWASHESFMNNPPNADQNVRLVLAVNGEIKDISSYGPPHGALDELFSRLLAIANGSGSER